MEEEPHKLQVSVFRCKEEWCPACRLEVGGGGGGGEGGGEREGGGGGGGG